MARVLRAAGACTVGLLAATIAAAPASASPPPAQVYFQAQATATAVHLLVSQQPASSIITRSLVDDAVGYAASDYDSSGSSDAQAAPAYPGDLVAQGPQLMCSQLFSCPTTPPSYPLAATASYPRTTSDSARLSQKPQGSGPLVVTPLAATAHARADRNSSATSAARTTVMAGTPAATTIGATQSGTTTTTTGSTLGVHVESVLHDVTVGGLVHIAAVRAVDDITVSDGRRPVDHPSVALTGVTVAGHSASIDNRGIHVDGRDGPSLSARLARQGISMRTVAADRSDTAAGSRSDATALSVAFAVPVSGLPYIPNPLPPLPPPFDQVPQLPGVDANGAYVGHLTLGSVGAAGGMQRQPPFSLGGVFAQPTGGSGAGSTGAATAGPVGGSQLVRSLAGTPGGGAPAVAAPAARGLRGFADAVSKDALDALYSVLALGTLALFVGWRGTVLMREGALARRRR